MPGLSVLKDSGSVSRGTPTHADDGAELLAFLSALLRLAFLVVDDGDTRERLTALLVLLLLGRHCVRGGQSTKLESTWQI